MGAHDCIFVRQRSAAVRRNWGDNRDACADVAPAVNATAAAAAAAAATAAAVDDDDDVIVAASCSFYCTCA